MRRAAVSGRRRERVRPAPMLGQRAVGSARAAARIAALVRKPASPPPSCRRRCAGAGRLHPVWLLRAKRSPSAARGRCSTAEPLQLLSRPRAHRGRLVGHRARRARLLHRPGRRRRAGLDLPRATAAVSRGGRPGLVHARSLRVATSSRRQPAGRVYGRQPAGPGRRPGHFHLWAQMKVTKAKGLNYLAQALGLKPVAVCVAPRNRFGLLAGRSPLTRRRISWASILSSLRSKNARHSIFVFPIPKKYDAAPAARKPARKRLHLARCNTNRHGFPAKRAGHIVLRLFALPTFI